MNKRAFFIAPYPKEGASARLRVLQFLPYLKDAGISYTFRPFLTSGFYNVLYKKGNTFKKAVLFIVCSAMRFADIVRALFYDVIFIHREAYPIGPPILEAILFLAGKKIIFDYDDAIYLPPEGSKYVTAALKCPWKTNFIIKHSALVIAGNEFLKNYASRFSKNITIIPTSIDTDKYSSSRQKMGDSGTVIGWIGSRTTQVFLKELEGVFLNLLEKYPDLEIHLIGDDIATVRHERIILKEWSLEREKQDIEYFDIGIMPAPLTDWTKGKCAFKAILYMSFSVPVVASPVGVNKDIVADGMNGYLAETPAEWEEKLSMLITHPDLRRSMGKAGRKTVEEGFSLNTNAPIFVDAVKRCVEK